MDDEENTLDTMDSLQLNGSVDVKRSATNGGASNSMRRGQIQRNASTLSTPRASKATSRTSSTAPDEKAPGKEKESSSVTATSAPAKMSRKPADKLATPSPPNFSHLPGATEEACKTFQVISDCLYGSRNIGSSEHDALDCDCSSEWRDGKNHACGEDSDCINRATKMECVDNECNCGDACQNQRFQCKQYANVSVIQTEKKGFGLRANTPLEPNDFIYEYIGEVINEPTFRRRMLQYDEEGIKHFYFMSLAKNEFVDATKKGNLGRFCNHSCNPNCYVDKWVVGHKLRMGIFASRSITAGEELVFNYNVDRYGAEPQPCYCGEPNCTGFIGGKTQTERATKLSVAIIEALGIEDGDSWDTTVAKKVRKRKASEDDQEYVDSQEPRRFEEDDVTKVMAALMQCKEKWIAVKLLGRIQSADDERVLHRVVRMHGYQILATTLNTFIDDDNVVLQILDILYKFPRLTKNKITDSKVESAVEKLATSVHETVAAESQKLLEVWGKLETAYRIPRKKLDSQSTTINPSFEDRRNMERDEPAPSKAAGPPPSTIVIPKGPRAQVAAAQRNAKHSHSHRQRKPPPQSSLPAGWFVTVDKSGRYYFYNNKGMTTWHRPTMPCVDEEPKGIARARQEQQALRDIIDKLTKEPPPTAHKSTTTTPPQPVPTPMPPVPEVKQEKWRSLPIEKQMKIYETTLAPHIRHVMDKFTQKLPKEELKKLAKEISKKLVASDYKKNRVENPTVISTKQQKKVKAFVHDFFDRAVVKYGEYERTRAERHAAKNHHAQAPSSNTEEPRPAPDTAVKDDVTMHDADDIQSSPSTGWDGRKRKRQAEDDYLAEVAEASGSATPLSKRHKETESNASSPPPPPPTPPPPPVELDMPSFTDEEQFIKEQEEALMRENAAAVAAAERRLSDETSITLSQMTDSQKMPSIEINEMARS